MNWYSELSEVVAIIPEAAAVVSNGVGARVATLNAAFAGESMTLPVEPLVVSRSTLSPAVARTSAPTRKSIP